MQLVLFPDSIGAELLPLETGRPELKDCAEIKEACLDTITPGYYQLPLFPQA